jgi:hypothetical protein
MRNGRRNWMLRRIALAFAVAAVAAPAAQAVPLEPGPTKAEDTPLTTDFPRGNTAPHGTVAPQGSVASVPRGNTAPHGVIADYAAPRGGEQPVTTSTPSFDWTDAGIGAGLAFGALLLAGAGAMSVRQYRRLGQV